MLDRRHRWLLACFTILILPHPAKAQLWLEAGVGTSSHEAIASQLDTDNAVIGLRYSGSGWMEASGGFPLRSSSWGWGTAAAGREWIGAGPTRVGVSASGQLYGYGSGSAPGSGSGWGGTIEVAPLLRHRIGTVGFELRAGPLTVWDGTSETDELRTILSSGVVADYQPSLGTRFEATGRYLWVSGEGFSVLGGGFSHDADIGGAWIRGGRWLSSEVDDPEWSAGGYLYAGERFQFYGSVHQDAEDPVYRTAGRRTWTVGAGFALSSRPPTAAVAPPLEIVGQQVSIRIPRESGSEPPSIAGDFTEWTPVRMEPDGDNWIARFALVPGIYEFSFLNQNGEWFLPSSILHRVPDEFGGENALIVVQ